MEDARLWVHEPAAVWNALSHRNPERWVQQDSDGLIGLHLLPEDIHWARELRSHIEDSLEIALNHLLAGRTARAAILAEAQVRACGGLEQLEALRAAKFAGTLGCEDSLAGAQLREEEK